MKIKAFMFVEWPDEYFLPKGESEENRENLEDECTDIFDGYLKGDGIMLEFDTELKTVKIVKGDKP